MPGLMLKLRPYESVIVNGAVIENGRRESRLRIATDNVNILRLREALEPHEVTTPLAEAYYAAQLAVVGALEPAVAHARCAAALADWTGEIEPDASDLSDDRSEGLAEHPAGDPDAVPAAQAALRATLAKALDDRAFYRIMRAIAPHLRRAVRAPWAGNLPPEPMPESGPETAATSGPERAGPVAAPARTPSAD